MRFRAFWLLAGLCFGCGGPGEDTLTVSGSTLGAEGEVLTRQIGRFQGLHPEIRLEVQQTPDDATQRHQLYVQWLNARVGRPDVLQLDVVWTAEFAAGGWLLPPGPLRAAAAGSLFRLPGGQYVAKTAVRAPLVPRRRHALLADRSPSSWRSSGASAGASSGLAFQRRIVQELTAGAVKG